MKKFEYWVGNKFISNLNQDLESFLNSKGKEGWELVSFTNLNSSSYINEYCNLIFKREILQ